MRSQRMKSNSFPFNPLCSNSNPQQLDDSLVQGLTSYIPQALVIKRFDSFSSSTDSVETNDSREEKSTASSQLQQQNIIAKRHQNFQVKKKTELCKTYQLGLVCPYGDKCSFAHGNQELRPKVLVPTNYRTTMCKQFIEKGCCNFGPRCQFLHKKTTKTSFNVPSTRVDYEKVFLNVLNSFQCEVGVNRINNFGNYTKKMGDTGVSRLPTFKNNCVWA